EMDFPPSEPGDGGFQQLNKPVAPRCRCCHTRPLGGHDPTAFHFSYRRFWQDTARHTLHSNQTQIAHGARIRRHDDEEQHLELEIAEVAENWWPVAQACGGPAPVVPLRSPRSPVPPRFSVSRLAIHSRHSSDSWFPLRPWVAAVGSVVAVV